MKSFIIINLQFEAEHRWAKCPIDDVKFLRDYHRHLFHVELTIPVNHDDRDIEFIYHKRKIEKYCRSSLAKKVKEGGLSCEMIAKILLEKYKASEVRVLEDGENGAKVVR